MTVSTYLLVTTLTGTFFAGVLLALPRHLTGPLAEHLGTSAARSDRLRTAFAALLVPMMLVSGLLLDKWGPQPLLMGGSLLAALGLAALDPSRFVGSRGGAAPHRWALPGMLLAAVGTAAVTVASLVLLPRALAPTNPVAGANLGCVFLALGALLTPALLRGLTHGLGFHKGLLVLALLCLTPAFCGMHVPAKDFGAPTAEADPGEVFRNVGLWVAAGVLLFYRPLEETLGKVTRGSLEELNVSEGKTAFWLGLFWLTFLGTRLLAGCVLRPTSETWEPWVVFILMIVAAVMFGNLIGNDRPAGRGLGLTLTAACLAPTLPVVLGLVLRAFPKNSGVACGTLLAAGSLGALLFPSLLHPASERHGPRVAQRLALGFTLVLIGLTLLLALVQPGRP